MMETEKQLYQIEEPQPEVKREVLHLSGIRSHGPATARNVDRPWPRQMAWREALRRGKKTVI